MEKWITSLFILLGLNSCFCQIESSSQRDFIFKNGLFFDGVIGVATIHQKYDYTNFKTYYDYNETIVIKPSFQTQIRTCINFKIGYNWIFGNREKWRPGFQLTFLNIGAITDFKQLFGMRTMGGIGHVGYSNIFKFNETSGLECNIKFGILVLDPAEFLSHYSPTGAINYGFEVKYRYKVLSVGIDFSRIEANFKTERYTSINNFAITIGAKF